MEAVATHIHKRIESLLHFNGIGSIVVATHIHKRIEKTGIAELDSVIGLQHTYTSELKKQRTI